MRRRWTQPYAAAINVPQLGPLDLVSGAAAAYSVARKLRAAYAGALIRIRRSTDNTEQDIGALPNGLLDTAAAAAFIGGGSGFIATIYDQSGNGRDVTQATADAQPAYVANAWNGRPGAKFDASNDRLNCGTGLGILRNVAGATLNAVAASTNAATASRLFMQVTTATATNARASLWRGRVSGQHQLGGRRLDADSFVQISGGAVSTGVCSVDTGVFDYASAGASLYKDGSEIVSSTSFQTAGNTSDTDSTIITLGGNDASATQACDGTIVEAIIDASALSTVNRQLIERNQGAFYGVSVT